jgi:hypothetical protein
MIDATRRIAHLEELCRRSPDHVECDGDDVRDACDSLERVLLAHEQDSPGDGNGLDRTSQPARDLLEQRSVHYVAQVVMLSSCRELDDFEDQATTVEGLELLRDLHDDLTEIARGFDSAIEADSRRVRALLADFAHSTQLLDLLVESGGDVTLTDGDEPIDAEDFVAEYCAEVADKRRPLTEAFEEFRSTYLACPGAQYAIDAPAARIFNAFSDAATAFEELEACRVHAVAAVGRFVGTDEIRRGEHRRPPPRAQAQQFGTRESEFSASSWSPVTDARAALETRCAADCPIEDGVPECTRLKQRLDELEGLFERSRKVSLESRYHFANERGTQLTMIRELCLASTSLQDRCELDAQPRVWRDRYLLYAVELLRLVGSVQAQPLGDYLAGKYGVDLRRPL